LPAGV
jgi:hypothetical protein